VKKIEAVIRQEQLEPVKAALQLTVHPWLHIPSFCARGTELSLDKGEDCS
jgi:nitrogen regulatory protein PII